MNASLISSGIGQRGYQIKHNKLSQIFLIQSEICLDSLKYDTFNNKLTSRYTP